MLSGISLGGGALTGGIDIVSSGIDAIGDVLGIGNNRGAKREKRGRLQDALEQAGVHADAVDNVHSDDWKELEKLAQFVKSNGKMAVAYLNETMPRGGFGGKKGPTASQVTANFNSWKQSKQPPSAPTTAKSQTQSSTGTGKTITNTMLYIAAAIAAIFFFGPMLRGNK